MVAKSKVNAELLAKCAGSMLNRKPAGKVDAHNEHIYVCDKGFNEVNANEVGKKNER